MLLSDLCQVRRLAPECGFGRQCDQVVMCLLCRSVAVLDEVKYADNGQAFRVIIGLTVFSRQAFAVWSERGAMLDTLWAAMAMAAWCAMVIGTRL